MRFLIDASLSPVVAQLLAEAGHDAVHVRDVLEPEPADAAIFDHATDDDRALVSADADFGEVLSRPATDQPSVVIFRRQTHRRPAEQATLLLLPDVAVELSKGAVVVIDEARLRVRRLPLRDDQRARPSQDRRWIRGR